jgi:hypothetical protein
MEINPSSAVQGQMDPDGRTLPPPLLSQLDHFQRPKKSLYFYNCAFNPIPNKSPTLPSNQPASALPAACCGVNKQSKNRHLHCWEDPLQLLQGASIIVSKPSLTKAFGQLPLWPQGVIRMEWHGDGHHCKRRSVEDQVLFLINDNGN